MKEMQKTLTKKRMRGKGKISKKVRNTIILGE